MDACPIAAPGGMGVVMNVEKTMEFILAQQAQAAALQIKNEEAIGRLERHPDRTDAILRRAIRLGVREARNERRRRQELDARFELKMDQLASAQFLSEQRIEKLSEKVDKLGEKVDKLVEGWRRGSGNGHPQP